MKLESIISLLSLFISCIGLYFIILNFLYPIYKDFLNRKILIDKFGRGPFDPETIERATKYYIKPKCSNIDPAQEQEPRHALMATKESLFDKTDDFINNYSDKRHLLILADSGMGKTSFVLNYYVYYKKKFRKNNLKLAIIPLGLDDADSRISKFPNKQNTVIILDAYDEDTKAIDNHKTRIFDLMHKCREFNKVILTSRTQFFPKDEEIPVETGIVHIGPREAGKGGVYKFWKLYLSPFDDADVKKYIKMRYPFWKRDLRKKGFQIIEKIPLLSVRPMLLSHIPDVISSGVEISDTYQLYEIMVDAWLERESKWADKSELRIFSENIAKDLYLNREQRGMERIPKEEMITLSTKINIKLESWQMSGRSLLNRDAEGRYKFSHRSIMEYLFIKKLVDGDNECFGIEITDLMYKFFLEMKSFSFPWYFEDLEKVKLFGVINKNELESVPALRMLKNKQSIINIQHLSQLTSYYKFENIKTDFSYLFDYPDKNVFGLIMNNGIEPFIIKNKRNTFEFNIEFIDFLAPDNFFELLPNKKDFYLSKKLRLSLSKQIHKYSEINFNKNTKVYSLSDENIERIIEDLNYNSLDYGLIKKQTSTKVDGTVLFFII